MITRVLVAYTFISRKKNILIRDKENMYKYVEYITIQNIKHMFKFTFIIKALQKKLEYVELHDYGITHVT